jgi:hypothetical protein
MHHVRRALPFLCAALAGDFAAADELPSARRAALLDALEDCANMCKVPCPPARPQAPAPAVGLLAMMFDSI